MEVVGFPNYLIYEDGRVWSKPRQGTKGGFIKNGTDGQQGYLTSCLQRKTFKLHTLVASHYLEDYNEKKKLGYQIDHIDNDISNNHKDNLRMIPEYKNRHGRVKKCNNKSGYKNIHQRENETWRFSWVVSNSKNEKIIIGRKTFKSKIDCIRYKFCMLLKFKLMEKNNII